MLAFGHASPYAVLDTLIHGVCGTLRAYAAAAAQCLGAVPSGSLDEQVVKECRPAEPLFQPVSVMR